MFKVTANSKVKLSVFTFLGLAGASDTEGLSIRPGYLVPVAHWPMWWSLLHLPRGFYLSLQGQWCQGLPGLSCVSNSIDMIMVLFSNFMLLNTITVLIPSDLTHRWNYIPSISTSKGLKDHKWILNWIPDLMYRPSSIHSLTHLSWWQLHLHFVSHHVSSLQIFSWLGI